MIDLLKTLISFVSSADFSSVKKALVLAVAILAAGWFGYNYCYDKGYDAAMTKIAIEKQAAEKAAQAKAKETYEKQIAQLTDDLARARELNANRMRQIERFNNTNRDLAACTRDRRDLAELAVRGEQLLKDAESYIRALRD